MIYLILSCIFFFLAIFNLLFPRKFRAILLFLLKMDLIFLIGLFEIATGLITLYFRSRTLYVWLTYLVGILLFVDGIFYLAAPRSVSDLLQQFITEKGSRLKFYSFLTLGIALCYLLFWLTPTEPIP